MLTLFSPTRRRPAARRPVSRRLTVERLEGRDSPSALDLAPQFLPPADPTAAPTVAPPGDAPAAPAAAPAIPATGTSATPPDGAAAQPAAPAASSLTPAGPTAGTGAQPAAPAAPPAGGGSQTLGGNGSAPSQVGTAPPAEALLWIDQFASQSNANSPCLFTLVGDVQDTANTIASVKVTIQGDGLNNGQATVSVGPISPTEGTFQVSVELPPNTTRVTAYHYYSATATDGSLVSQPFTCTLYQPPQGS